MRIWTSIRLIILGVVLLAAGLGLSALTHFLSPENLRDLVLTGFGRNVNATLQIQRVNLDLPGTVHVEGVKLTPPTGGQPVFDCPHVQVELRPSALLTGRVVPRSVALVSPVIRLTYSADDGPVERPIHHRPPGERRHAVRRAPASRRHRERDPRRQQ